MKAFEFNEILLTQKGIIKRENQVEHGYGLQCFYRNDEYEYTMDEYAQSTIKNLKTGKSFSFNGSQDLISERDFELISNSTTDYAITKERLREAGYTWVSDDSFSDKDGWRIFVFKNASVVYVTENDAYHGITLKGIDTMGKFKQLINFLD